MTVAAEIKRLQGMTVAELKEKWRQLYGEEPRSRHREYLWRRLAWKVQEIEYGGLSGETRRRIEELIEEFDIAGYVARRGQKRANPGDAGNEGMDVGKAGQKGAKVGSPKRRDANLPKPGSLITRTYQGREIVVAVTKTGFEYEGKPYRSLTAIAKEVTGGHWSGPRFFGLNLKR